ncbi:hypothetical protein [Arthrobacter sp.]|uniref:hypothetical protein n=1 Tax=Arthrobacter sp. TaxID=1667 RepID=UPI0025880F44|nr:hypothetical protein [Arthrobacter sp.]
MSGEHTAAGAKRALILALAVPLLAGCTPYGTQPDRSPVPSGSPVATASGGTVTGPADLSTPDIPYLPPPPSSGPLIMDTSKVTQQVVLKVDRMTKPTWDVHIRDMLKGQVTYSVQCLGKGTLVVSLRPAVEPAYSVRGDCAAPGELATFGGSAAAPPDGSIDVAVTAPPGARWALLVTQPAGS